MKNLVKVLGISLVVFILSGCSTNKLGEKSEYGKNVNNFEGVSIELNKDTFEPKGDTFELTVINDSEEEVSYGVEYILEYQKDDGTWYKVESEQEPGFVMLLVNLPPGAEDTDEINLDFYEPMDTGHYRVIRHIGEEPLAAEFDVSGN